MHKHSTSLFSLFHSIIQNKNLIWQMTKRNVIGKYRGSLFGLLWSFLNPLIMLAVYTFAFSVVFQAKWGIENESHLDFALILFASFSIFNLFGDLIKESPGLILANPNYVKKVIFPLEILPIISLLSVCFHTGVSLIIFFILFGVTHFFLPWTLIFLPVIIVPLLLLSLGISYFLASLGVYLRDIGHLIGHLVTILLFTSPVFFSMDKIPKSFQKFMILNPIAFLLEASRSVMIFGKPPNWTVIFIYFIVGFLSLFFGFWWFQKTRKGFADVL